MNISQAEVAALDVQNGSLVRKRHKYGAAPKEKRTNAEGIVFDSKREMEVYEALRLQLKAGLIKRLDRQVKYPILLNDVHVCTVIIDFRVTHPDHSLEAIEVKGVATPVWRLKEKLFRAAYSKTRLTVVK